jgi:hypothetical protein
MRSGVPARRTAGLVTASLAAVSALAGAGSAHAGLEILGPEEVTARFLHARDGDLFLRVDGRERELVIDPRSPLVSQLGDGDFHPMDPRQVRDAVGALERGLLPPDGRILVLPFPRRDAIKSTCEGRTIFLSPGIREVSSGHVHATVTHEIGHLFQHVILPETSALWSEYVERRGIAGDSRYHSNARHRDRPREIFAEDFRYLFGGAVANYSGNIENPDLPTPDQVPGLRTWLESVLPRSVRRRGELGRAPPRSAPNPLSLSEVALMEIRFQGSRPAGRETTAEVYDLRGRRVRTLLGSAGDPDEVVFVWNGRDSASRHVASGVYFVRWRQDPAAGTARVHVLR